MATPPKTSPTPRSAASRLASQVTIKQLRAFAAVAREGSFTAAAQQLFISQSALSALVRTLEAALGLRLLDRTTRRLELTTSGQDLVPTVQRLLDDLDRMAGDLFDVTERRRGRVRVGATPLLAGLIGVLVAPVTTMYYDSGFLIGLKAFVAAIIGGLVSYPLTAIGALAVGAVESFASFYSGAFKDVIVFSLLIPVLMLRSFMARHVEEDAEEIDQ